MNEKRPVNKWFLTFCYSFSLWTFIIPLVKLLADSHGFLCFFLNLDTYYGKLKVQCLHFNDIILWKAPKTKSWTSPSLTITGVFYWHVKQRSHLTQNSKWEVGLSDSGVNFTSRDAQNWCQGLLKLFLQHLVTLFLAENVLILSSNFYFFAAHSI